MVLPGSKEASGGGLTFLAEGFGFSVMMEMGSLTLESFGSAEGYGYAEAPIYAVAPLFFYVPVWRFLPCGIPLSSACDAVRLVAEVGPSFGAEKHGCLFCRWKKGR